MNKRVKPITPTREEAVTGGIAEACSRYGLGKASMRRVAEDAGAVVRVGRRFLIHYGRVDAYLLHIAE